MPKKPPAIDWTDLVTIIVGPEKKSFVAHANVLKRINFFRGCLDSGMKEARERVVRLPEDDVEAFDGLLYWAYHGRFELDLKAMSEAAGEQADELQYSSPENDDRWLSAYAEVDAEVSKLFKVYALAEKFCTESAMNDAMDSIVAAYYGGHPTSSSWRSLNFAHLDFVLEYTKEDDPARDFFKYVVADGIVCRHGSWQDWRDEEEPYWLLTSRLHWKKNVDRMSFVMDAMIKYPDDKLPCHTDKRPSCTWHTHIDTPECRYPHARDHNIKLSRRATPHKC